MTLEQETKAAMGRVVVMRAAVATEFERMDGTGRTVEYLSDAAGPPQTLAYLDYDAERTRAAVAVFYPYKGARRLYAERPAGNALAIIERHLLTEGYVMPDNVRVIG